MRKRLAGIVVTAMAGIALVLGITVGAATASAAPSPTTNVANTWYDM
jgi:hypothetical protein